MLSNILELTVSEFSRSVKMVLEDAFGYLRIRGEVVGLKRAASGHLYFNLKDGDALLTAVCFRNMAQMINVDMIDGLQIVVSGKITAFEGRSNYQIIVEKVEMAGIGAVLEMIEKRRKKLLEEGLFDNIHKKSIPFFPKIIGVITSETGAVIQDIKHRIEDRCPSNIMLYSTAVQGLKAALEIIEAIKFFNQMSPDKRPEVIIIARGGGSFEDLLPFNDENLVREVFKSKIPIISAIGHETDVTLIDYVSDLRAPTPTAAAEIATPVLSDLKRRLNYLQEKLQFLPLSFIAEKKQILQNLQRYTTTPAQLILATKDRLLGLEKRFFVSFDKIFEQKNQKLNSLQVSNQMVLQQIDSVKQKVDFLFKSFESRLSNDLENKKNHLYNLEKLLKSHHYKEILKRGFALVKNINGFLITSINEIKIKDKFIVEISDGNIEGEVVIKNCDKKIIQLHKNS